MTANPLPNDAAAPSHLQQIITALTEGVILVQPDRVPGRADETALQLTGFRQGDLIGRSMHQIDVLRGADGDQYRHRHRLCRFRRFRGQHPVVGREPGRRQAAGESRRHAHPPVRGGNPVEETVMLHDERVVLDRRPVTDDRLGGTADFSETTIEMTETAEEAVVSKTAHVYEEVGRRKEHTDRAETIRDTVRREKVAVENSPATTTTTTSSTIAAPLTPKV